MGLLSPRLVEVVGVICEELILTMRARSDQAEFEPGLSWLQAQGF